MINLLAARQQAILNARQLCASRPLYAEIETTGLGPFDEIVAISIIEDDEEILLETLVKPSQPIPSTATLIHGIVDVDVQDKHTWPVIWPTVRSLLLWRVIACYNEDFFLRMMQQSLARHNISWKDKFNMVGVQKIYSQFKGDWDPKRRTFQYHPLAKACAEFNIEESSAHRTTTDASLTRALLHAIADLTVDG